MRKVTGLVIVFGLVLLLVGIGSGIAAQDKPDGQALYEKKCGLCHGKDGVAKKMAAGSSNLNDPEWQKSTSVDEIVKLTNEGKGKMKGFQEKLSQDEIKAIATYVLTLK